MLNNRGWGLRVMMVCILILMLALVVISFFANKLNKILNEEYVNLENRIVEAAIKYETDNNLDLDVIKVQKLIDENYLMDYTVEGYQCSGYVKKEINYKAYIKCDNYITVGYSNGYSNQ